MNKYDEAADSLDLTLLNDLMRDVAKPVFGEWKNWKLEDFQECYAERYAMMSRSEVKNAKKIAEFLESHKKIAEVIYPGLESHPQYHLAKKQMRSGGAMIAFKVKGSKAECFTFVNKLEIIDISNNLGDSRSLITHPATTTHSNIAEEERDMLGITNNLLRLSVGIEDVEDLIADISAALD